MSLRFYKRACDLSRAHHSAQVTVAARPASPASPDPKGQQAGVLLLETAVEPPVRTLVLLLAPRHLPILRFIACSSSSTDDSRRCSLSR